MSQKHHINHHALKGLLKVVEQMEPLRQRKDPALAAIAGLFGAVGIGLYFRTWRDLFWSFGICIAVLIIAAPTGETLSILAPIICAIYGYHRCKSSNLALEARANRDSVV